MFVLIYCHVYHMIAKVITVMIEGNLVVLTLLIQLLKSISLIAVILLLRIAHSRINKYRINSILNRI